jgi:HAD superfamily hydrolase (TIGR01509 family)
MSAAPRSWPEAVLFDMDGTLVDSEKLWEIALNDLAAHYGGQLSAQARAEMVGTNMAVSMKIFHDDLGLGPDYGPSQRMLEQRTKELFVQGLPWRRGAQELLHEVHEAGLPTALVTSTHRHLVDVALATLGPQYFDVVVCGDEVDQAKPHPKPYLQAAALLGVDPGRCVAIEDSPVGVASAVAAGCAVLVVPSEIEVPAGERRTIRPSLAGVNLAFLSGLGPVE